MRELARFVSRVPSNHGHVVWQPAASSQDIPPWVTRQSMQASVERLGSPLQLELSKKQLAGCGTGVGRDRGVGVGRGACVAVGVGVAVAVAVAVGVNVAVAVAVGVNVAVAVAVAVGVNVAVGVGLTPPQPSSQLPAFTITFPQSPLCVESKPT